MPDALYHIHYAAPIFDLKLFVVSLIEYHYTANTTIHILKTDLNSNLKGLAAS